jgi:hypothetical protein
MSQISIHTKEDAALQAVFFDSYCEAAIRRGRGRRRGQIPEAIHLPVNTQTAVRLVQDDPETLAAYLFQRIRVTRLLERKVDRVRQFTRKHAEMRLMTWDAWVRSGGSYAQAHERHRSSREEYSRRQKILIAECLLGVVREIRTLSSVGGGSGRQNSVRLMGGLAVALPG